MLRAMIQGVRGSPGWRSRKRTTEAPRSRKNAVWATVVSVRVSSRGGGAGYTGCSSVGGMRPLSAAAPLRGSAPAPGLERRRG